MYCQVLAAKNSFDWLVQTNAHIDTNSHIKLQKDTLQVERNLKRQLKDFLLKAYVLFMCVSGDSGSGKWLFISFIPLHLKMSSFVWIWQSFWPIIEGCGDALYSEMHIALIIQFFFTNKQEMSLSLLLVPSTSGSPSITVISLHISLSLAFSRWYAGPVEVESPSWKDQRQPLQAEGDRWLGDCQSRPTIRFLALNTSCYFSIHSSDCFWFEFSPCAFQFKLRGWGCSKTEKSS